TLNLTRPHRAIAQESRFQGLGINSTLPTGEPTFPLNCQAGTRLVTSNDPSPSMESAIPVSLATVRTDADATVVQHSKTTRNESANAMDLTVSIIPLKSHVYGQLASRCPGSRAPPA